MMKKVILMTAVLASTSAFAQLSADDLKKSTLEACQTQAAALPEEQRAMVEKVCTCSAENTDYELMLKAQSGDQDAVTQATESAMKVGQKCASMAAS